MIMIPYYKITMQIIMILIIIRPGPGHRQLHFFQVLANYYGNYGH